MHIRQREMWMYISRFRFFIFFCCSVLVISFGIWASGEFQILPANQWEVSTPANEKVDPQLLDAMQSSVHSKIYRNIHSILIIKNGRLIFEKYFGQYKRRTLQYTASVSKSVGSILVGIAIQQGRLEGIKQGLLERSLSDLFPEYADPIKADVLKDKILFKHALTMSAGFQWDEQSFPYSDSRNDWNAASHSRDPITYLLGKPMSSAPGETFNYNGGLSIMLSYLIEQTAGQKADRFARKYLFEPLGIKDFRWDRLANGLTDTDGGLHLTPRDMAKLGYLYLNKGMWNEHRIVPEDWVTESTKEHQINDDSPNYGFQWWCGRFHFGFRSVYTFFASGHGGQKIFIFPGLDCVVVLTHQVFDNPYGELNNISLLSRYILPALQVRAESLQIRHLDPQALKAYTGRYTSKSDRMILSLKDGKLFVESEDGQVFEIHPVSPTRFQGTVLDLVDVCFEFSLDNDHKVNSVVGTFGFRNKLYIKVD